MPKGRQNIVERAYERGGGKVSTIVNGDRLLPALEDGTLRSHQVALNGWEDYVNHKLEKTGTRPSAYNLRDLKGFMEVRAKATRGTNGQPACVETVRHYWNAFTGGWKRKHGAIPRDITDSVTAFIYGPLKEELGLLAEKRPRRYANENHLHLYAEQLWARDWYIYQKPETRVSDWGLFLSNIFSTSRIGEYIESSARRGSDRGLYYKDVMFVCFSNENGQPELAIQLTKDAKNMSKLPKSKRPRHALTEGKDPQLLCFNTLLPFLSKLLEIRAFRDHETIEDLLAVEPPEHARACHIVWRDDILEAPFFESQSTTRVGRIETANAFSRRNADLGIRAGMPEPPTQHDWRAESLFKIDKHYSESIRMGQAGQQNPQTYRRYYQPSNGGVDGQGTFLGNKRREVVNDVFRELSIPYNPNLSQRLPAAEKYRLESSQESVALEEEIASLMGNRDSEARKQLEALRRKKRNMADNALKLWQTRQPHKPNDQPEYHQSLFERVRFMMPERDRLARDLFQVSSLRDPLGLSVLRDMMALYRQTSEAEFRPGLERDKCCCTKKEESDQYEFGGEYDWKHIYDCYRQDCRTIHGFADLCFLCSEWVFGKEKWRDHCRKHVDDLSTFPTQFDPLLHDGILASPGYCPFCLESPALEPEDRMHQFLYRAKWLEHIQRHVTALRKSERENQSILVVCPARGQLCPKNFQGVLELEFHLQDIHGVDMPKPSKARKRSKVESEEVPPMMKKRQRRDDKQEVSDDHFVHTTTEMMANRLWTGSAGSSCRSTSTPPSSVLSDVLIDPEILNPSQSPPDYSNMEVVPTVMHDRNEPNCAILPATQNEFAQESTNNFSTASIIPWGEKIGSQLSLDKNLKSIKGDMHPGKALLSSDGPHGGLPPLSKEVMPIEAVESSADHQPSAVDPEDNQYKVEKLVRKRRRKGKIQYLVKWLGYSDTENNWEAEWDIDPDLVATFETSS